MFRDNIRRHFFYLKNKEEEEEEKKKKEKVGLCNWKALIFSTISHLNCCKHLKVSLYRNIRFSSSLGSHWKV